MPAVDTLLDTLFDEPDEPDEAPGAPPVVKR
jgi:hypothetical protein